MDAVNGEVSGSSVLRLIRMFLESGVMENGVRQINLNPEEVRSRANPILDFRIGGPQISRGERILHDFNESTLDSAGPVSSDQGMAVLNEMNDLQSDHDDYLKSLAPHMDAL